MNTRVALLLALALAGCAPEVESPRVAREAVVSGQPACSNPEVGLLRIRVLDASGSAIGSSICTGTLISEDVVVSAAHCVAFLSCVDGLGRCESVLPPLARERDDRVASVDVSFFLGDGSGHRTRGYAVRALESYGRFAEDIAILHLDERVPSSLARPAPIASSRPSPSDELFFFGYGCSERGAFSAGGGAGSGVRRVAMVRAGESSVGCPGDSGGPNLDASGRLVRTNQAYGLLGDDRFADPIARRAEFEARMRAWGAAPLRAAGTAGTTPVRPESCAPSLPATDAGAGAACDLDDPQQARCTTALGADVCPGTRDLTTTGCEGGDAGALRGRYCWCETDTLGRTARWNCSSALSACQEIGGGGSSAATGDGPSSGRAAGCSAGGRGSLDAGALVALAILLAVGRRRVA